MMSKLLGVNIRRVIGGGRGIGVSASVKVKVIPVSTSVAFSIIAPVPWGAPQYRCYGIAHLNVEIQCRGLILIRGQPTLTSKKDCFVAG